MVSGYMYNVRRKKVQLEDPRDTEIRNVVYIDQYAITTYVANF